MKNVLYWAAAGLLAASCDAPRSATEQADPAVRSEAVRGAAAAPVSFRRELTEGDFRFELQTTGAGTQRQLQLRVERNGRELATTTQAVAGTVTDAVAANLNDDKYPELLVFVADAGSGSYGQLLGYEFLNQGRRNLQLPELSAAAAQGYQGHDEFRVDGQQVLRTFPVYRAADANCCPSGGRRTVRYVLPSGLATFREAGMSTAAR